MQRILEARNIQVKRDQKIVFETQYLDVIEGEVLAVIGPNGAGKSTLLMALSQLLPVSGGEIVFLGKTVLTHQGLEFRRQIAMALQEPLLMDTSVYDNVASGLRFRRIKRKEIEARVDFWLKAFNINNLRKRKAHKLSGGEAQRVSLARAFCLQPKILFLDEPFGALDKPTRNQLLQDFSKLQKQTHTTTVLVTHDLDEALFLADRVAVVINGMLRQVGTPQEVFSAPADMEIARFVGIETIITGKIIEKNEGVLRIQSDGLILEAVGEYEIGEEVYLCLRPEDITIWKNQQHLISSSSARNRFVGTIRSITSAGVLERVVIDSEYPVVSLITRLSRMEMALEPGDLVELGFKASAAHIIHKSVK